jgi:hypothetical protein
MKIALDTAVGKEAFINIIVAVHVAPSYLLSLCERSEKPAASMFKAEDLKREDIFFQNLVHYLGYVTIARRERQQASSS